MPYSVLFDLICMLRSRVKAHTRPVYMNVQQPAPWVFCVGLTKRFDRHETAEDTVDVEREFKPTILVYRSPC